MPRKKAQSPNNEDEATVVSSAAQTTKQVRSQSYARDQSPQEGKTGKPNGSYQPSRVPRRNAPVRPRGQSVESVATADFPQSSYDLGEKASPPGRQELLQPEDEGIDESQEDEIQEIIEWTLPDLSRWSKKTYDTVIKAEAGPPGRIPWNRLATIDQEFEVLRHKITSSRNSFINPNQWHVIMDKIAGGDHFEATLKSVVEANIALLLKLILQITHDKVDAQPVLQELNRVFPALFQLGSDQEPIPYTLSEYEKQYGIKCLMLAFIVTNDKQTSPTILAADLFCDKETFKKDPRRVKYAKDMLLKGPYDMFDGNLEEADSAITKQHQRNMVTLCERLAQRNRAEIAKSLQDMYPMERLLEDLARWARQSYQSLQAFPVHIEGKSPQPLVASVQSAPGSSQNQVTSTASSTKALQPIVQQVEDIQSSIASADNEELFVPSDQEQSVHPQEQSESDSEPDEPIVRTGPPTGSYLDGGARLGLKSNTLGARTRVTPPSNQQATRNPLASLNAADIVSSYRSEGLANGHSSSRAAPGGRYANGRKRSVVDEDAGGDSEDDEENEFQTDTRPVNESRRAIVDTRRDSGRPVKRGRTRDNQSFAGIDSRRSPSGSANLDQEAEDFQPTDIRRLSQKAREATRVAAREREVRQPRPLQKREKWSDEDATKLLGAIARHGCVWTTLEELNVFSLWRSQQQIRDKARNIKVDLLKTDSPLPANFDGVALGKKEKDAVKLLGKNPERKEDDVSRDGRVMNTVWVDELEHIEQSERSRSERRS